MSLEASQPEIIDTLKQKVIPHHVAIIMDGNGRWAQGQGKPRVFGHKKGVESVRCVVETAGKLGVKILTLYAFSEENWGRPKPEISTLMSLLNTYVVKEREKLHEANVKFRVMGNLSKLPEKTRKLVAETEQRLSQNTGLTLNIALSYGARQEITVACQELARKTQNGELDFQEITPDLISKHLWTKDLGDPDLFIRTSGEQRVSNFLLWQIAYTELWFSSVFWPEFREPHFFEAIRGFQSRQRRFGLTSES